MNVNYDIVDEILKNGKRISILKTKENQRVLKKQVVNSSDTSTIYSLKNELSCLSMLKETRVVPKVLEYNFDTKDPYIIMEFINYYRLYDVSFSNLEQKIICMIKILDAVNKIHKKEIIHCDLKPQNILVGKNYDIKIIDFGISVIKGKQEIINYGSLNYCSPEQLNKKNVTNQSDIYSLGIILYKMLMGKLPYERNESNLRDKIDYKNIPKIEDEKLNKIIFTAIDQNIEKRYKNVMDYKNDLMMYLMERRNKMSNIGKYLPLGSVVLMKDAKKRVMVTGYAIKTPESGDKLWDYIGCIWPEGMISPDKNLLFDHKDIHQIYAIGYTDEEQKKFLEVLNKATELNEQRQSENTNTTDVNSSQTLN